MINIKKALLLTVLPATLISSAYLMNVYAETDNTVSVDGSYEVSIPADVSFDSTTKTNTMSISGKVNKLHDLNVSISSENDFKLKQNDVSIDYVLKDGDTELKSGDSWSFPEGNDYSKYEAEESTFNKELTLSTYGGQYAGDYTDKLTFTLTDTQCYHLGVNVKDSSITSVDVQYDVYINGKLISPGTAAFSKYIPKGSTYEVKNILVKNDKYVYGGSEGDLSGTVNERTSVYLNFVPTTNTVTFNLNAEDAACDTTSKKVAKGYAYGTLPTPTREGYVFSGWYTDATDGETVTEDSVFSGDSDVTLYAHWQEYSYKLVTGQTLSDKIRSKATHVVFTDKKAPTDATVQDLSSNKDGSVVGWWNETTYNISTQVSGKAVIFNENSGAMFFNCSKLTSIDFLKVDTSEVTTMEGMFTYSGITTLDLRNFDTSNVTDMGRMFSGTNLTELDISNFDTSKVKDMSDMFNSSSKLTSLNIKALNTENVTNMNSMFMDCTSLTSLNLSNFDMSNVIDISCMFANDSNLESIFVAENFVLNENAEEKDGYPMFSGCSKLPNYDADKVDKTMAKSVSSGGYLYVNERKVTFDANGGEFAEGSITSKIVEKGQKFGTLPTVTKDGYTFAGWHVQDYGMTETITEDSDFYYDINITLKANWVVSYQLATGSEFNDAIPILDKYTGEKSVTKVVFTDTTAPSGTELTDLSGSKDNSVVGWLDDTTWYVSTQKEGQKVIFNEDSSGMFFTSRIVGAFDFRSIDFSNIDTSKVQNMNFMFAHCEALETIDLSNFDTSNATFMNAMFYDCSNLQTLDLTNIDTSNVTDMYFMFGGCEKLKYISASSKFVTTSVTSSEYMFADCTSLPNYDESKINKEMAKSVSEGGYFYMNGKVVTFDLNLEGATCDTTMKVVEQGDKYGTLPTPTADGYGFVGWFTDATGGDAITEDITFDGDSDITLYAHWIEYSYKLMSGSEFFSKLSGIDSNATSLVFTDTTAPDTATTYDLTKNQDESVVGWVEDTTWYVSTQSTGKKVIFNEDSSYMFNKRYADDSEYQFESITFGEYVNTSQVTNMDGMFRNCQGLESLDFSSFDTSNVTSMSGMFYQCVMLKKLDLSTFNTSKVTNMSYMFKWVGLESLDLRSFDTSSVTNMMSMFAFCGDMTDLDLSSFDTRNVTNMSWMFANCVDMTDLDLSSFDTTNVTNTSTMFRDCNKLTTTYVRTQADLEKLSAASETPSTIAFVVKESDSTVETQIEDVEEKEVDNIDQTSTSNSLEELNQSLIINSNDYTESDEMSGENQ